MGQPLLHLSCSVEGVCYFYLASQRGNIFRFWNEHVALLPTHHAASPGLKERPSCLVSWARKLSTSSLSSFFLQICLLASLFALSCPCHGGLVVFLQVARYDSA